MILVKERTNAGGGHLFNVAVVNEINFNLQREREGRGGRESKKGKRERETKG